RCYRDWSSDVCSSDLVRRRHRLDLTERSLENAALPDYFFKIVLGANLFLKVKFLLFQPLLRFGHLTMFQGVVDSDGDLARDLCRSEERRVGEVCSVRG